MLPSIPNEPRHDIEYVDPKSLASYENAPRSHNSRARRSLAASIRQNGLIDPIIIDEDGQILSGELRRDCCVELGFDRVPVIRISWMTRAQKRAYRIAANRIPELAEWDDEKLRIELQHLVEFDIDLDLETTGFETGEIDLILQHNDPSETVDDVIPAPPAAPVSRPGDLWRLGDHLLLCGSCLDAGSWKRLLGDEKARLCLTDPPFNVPIRGHVTSGSHTDFAMASGEMSSPQFVEFLSTALGHAVSHTLEGGLHLVAMDWRHLRELFAAADPLYAEQLNLVVWSKTNAGMGSLYRSRHELWALYKVGTAAHVNNVALGRYGRNRSNVWSYAGANSFRRGRDKDLADHPTVKPTALVVDAILDLTHTGEVVVDGFGGSGTLILAAEKTRRKARVIELEPKFVDVAIRRWEAMTGELAVLDATGEPFEAVREQRLIPSLPAPASGGES